VQKFHAKKQHAMLKYQQQSEGDYFYSRFNCRPTASTQWYKHPNPLQSRLVNNLCAWEFAWVPWVSLDSHGNGIH